MTARFHNVLQRVGINALRSGHHWPPEIPDLVWAPLATAALLAGIGVLGILMDEPMLFPSLGPTAFLQTEDPEVRMARFYNTVVGHLIGLGSGLFAVTVLHAEASSSVLVTGHLVPIRIVASALAVLLTIALGLLLRASHPPASATTLLVALGAFSPTLRTALIITASVLLIGILGELLRRFRLGKLKKITL